MADDTDKAELLAEAYKRGLLPPEAKALYEEAQRRGLIKPAAPEGTGFTGLAQRADRRMQGAVTGLGEAGLSLASGAVATPVAGAVGASEAPFVGMQKAAQDIESIQQAGTYQPRTKAGQRALEVATAVPQALAHGADVAGAKAAELTTDVTGSREAGAAVGATVNTLLQAAPAILLKLRRGSVKAAPQLTDEGATNVAQRYARDNGLDWDSLHGNVKGALTEIAKKAGTLEGLDHKAVARQAKLQSLRVPVPATQGQLTKDPVQLRREANAAATDAGAPIRDVDEASNKAILDNLDILKGKVKGKGLQTAGKAESETQVGQSVQDEALRRKSDLSKERYKALYKKARSTEPDAVVSPKSLYDMLEKNPEVQHLGWMKGWLDRAKLRTTTPDGAVVTRKVPLSELHDLREKAGDISAIGGTDGYYAKKVLSAIDEAAKSAPESARAWKRADKAFSEHQKEFKDQPAVKALVTDKRGTTSRATALEDTWNRSVIGGSIDDLNRVKRSLLTGVDKETRTAGRRAWRDMKGQTVQFIKDRAARGVGRTPGGQRQVTMSGLDSALKSIDSEWPNATPKLDVIFGKDNVNELKKIYEATDIVKNDPRIRAAGSTTLQNVLSFLEKIPGVGHAAGGAVRLGHKVMEIGKAGREATAATTQTPLSEALGAARSQASTLSKVGREARKSYVPIQATTLGEDRQ